MNFTQRELVQKRFDAIQLIRDSNLPDQQKNKEVIRLANGADPDKVLAEHGLGKKVLIAEVPLLISEN